MAWTVDPITTIQDNLTLTLAEAKVVLKIDASDVSEDTFLTRGIAASLEAADHYCNNEDIPIPIPSSVEQWCYKQIAYNYERRANALARQKVDGLAEVDWKWEIIDLQDLDMWRSNPGF